MPNDRLCEASIHSSTHGVDANPFALSMVEGLR